MGGVGDEAPLGGHQLLQPGGHAVELAAEGAYLGRTGVLRSAGFEITAAETAGGALEIRSAVRSRTGPPPDRATPPRASTPPARATRARAASWTRWSTLSSDAATATAPDGESTDPMGSKATRASSCGSVRIPPKPPWSTAASWLATAGPARSGSWGRAATITFPVRSTISTSPLTARAVLAGDGVEVDGAAVLDALVGQRCQRGGVMDDPDTGDVVLVAGVDDPERDLEGQQDDRRHRDVGDDEPASHPTPSRRNPASRTDPSTTMRHSPFSTGRPGRPRRPTGGSPPDDGWSRVSWIAGRRCWRPDPRGDR